MKCQGPTTRLRQAAATDHLHSQAIAAVRQIEHRQHHTTRSSKGRGSHSVGEDSTKGLCHRLTEHRMCNVRNIKHLSQLTKHSSTIRIHKLHQHRAHTIGRAAKGTLQCDRRGKCGVAAEVITVLSKMTGRTTVKYPDVIRHSGADKLSSTEDTGTPLRGNHPGGHTTGHIPHLAGAVTANPHRCGKVAVEGR